MVRIGIVGYGNLGRGVECAIRQNEDLTLAAVFTRRDPEAVKILTPGVPVVSMEQAVLWKEKLDVLILCGGSAMDLPKMSPELARDFHIVDSFDTHANIPAHFAAVDEAAKAGKKVAVIAAGWDPGLFSLNRLYGQAILPQGRDYTFWGIGVSQGHSDAIRRIPGVLDARQYTIPVAEAMERVRCGEEPELTAREKHTRCCYVVAQEGADKAAIEAAIKTMPHYFADYHTTVEFVTMEVLEKHHKGMPHGGSVIRTGRTGWELEHHQTMEFKLTLSSNPQFTANILAACARAAVKMADRGLCGCQTIFDIPPADLSPALHKDLIATLL